MRSNRLTVFALACTTLVVLATALTGLGAESGPSSSQGSTLIITEENDYFAGTDEHYTNGIKLNWISRDLKGYVEDERLPRFVMPYLGVLPFVNRPGQVYNIGIALGQNMYVPQNTRATYPLPNDRPYAGWTYVSLAVHAKTPTQLDTIETSVGIIGPSSLAGETQNTYHSLIGIQRVEGWNNQLKNEPGVLLTWQRTLRVKRVDFGHDMAWDLLPHLRTTLGNVQTLAAVGFETRLGYRLPWDFGTSLIQPGGGVSAPADPDDPRLRQDTSFGLHVFAGAEARAVARNIFLDGNTWQDSMSVTKKPFVADIMAGVGLVMGRFKLTYTQVYRTEEFEKQNGPQKFGSVSLAMTF